MSGAAWGKFFWSDWRSDPALKLCSLSARGLWIDMLTLMAEADGYLLVKGKKPDNRMLARLIGATEEEVAAAIAELEENEVFSRDRRGVIYSRKMVRAEKKASTARENGKKGGNPSLGKDKGSGASDNPTGTKDPTKLPGNNQKPDTRISPPTPPPGDEGGGGLFGDQPEPPAKPVDEVKVAFDLWNETAHRCGLSAAETLNDQRRSAIKARLAESGLDGWKRAMKAVEASPLCRGLVAPQPGRKQFRAHLDFVLQPSSFTKLLEGFYGTGAPPPAAVPKIAAWTGPDWILEAARPFGAERWLAQATWQAEPPAIIASSRFVAERLDTEIGSDLRKRGVRIITQGAKP